jgi:EAL domain-containing protein (putative c-di-GMP-specific phosphodiesterase class I)
MIESDQPDPFSRGAPVPHAAPSHLHSPLHRHAEVPPASERDYRHGDLILSSVFQPIFSLSHMRAAGYEALLRAHDPFDRPVSPLEVFGNATRDGDLLQLDRLSQTMHLENFHALGCEREWLFLNVQPSGLIDRRHSAGLLANLRAMKIPPQRIVLEVLEQSSENIEKLADAVEFFRDQGFLIALDDFGCGHSNIDRVWQLQPDIVKLDRSMLTQNSRRAPLASLLGGLVALLHEAGKLVLVEGVETETEALLAMTCNADFAQGFYFGRPSVAPVDSVVATDTISALTDLYRTRAEAAERREAARLAPYIRAFERAVERMAAGEPLDEVCWNFLSIEHAARCFLLDVDGRQVGRNVAARVDDGLAQMRRFLPVSEAQGASWLRRPYFRNAINAPNVVHATRPYLSINEATLCVTLSMALTIGEQRRVLCADIDWRHASEATPSFE